MSENLKKSIYRERDGVSLLIAIGLVTVITLFSLIVSNVVVTSIRQSANVNQANKAFFNTEGALEQGLLANSKQGAGYSSGETAANNLDATFEIEGQVPIDLKYGGQSDFFDMYGAPTPGSGDVGENCDPNNPWLDKGFSYDNGVYMEESSLGYDPADHPCNWNKVTVGEVVSIPLYVYDPVNCPSLQAGICNPADLGLTNLKVRVRAPCSDGQGHVGDEFCTPSERFTLDEEFGDPEYACDLSGSPTVGCGDTIISWSITGRDLGDTKTYQLVPLAAPNQLFYDAADHRRLEYASEIYEFFINKAASITLGSYDFGCERFCVLSDQSGGEDVSIKVGNPYGTLLQFLLNDSSSAFARSGNDVLHKPILKLAVINSLRDSFSGNHIPYLEYQIISDVSASYSPTDASQTIRAEGYSGEFKQILEVKQPQESGFLEYVIQQ